MHQFVDSIRTAVTSQNWFGALFMALAIPDICAALEDGKASGKQYKSWFNRYLKLKYNPDSKPLPEDEMALRVQRDEYFLASLARTKSAEEVESIREVLDYHARHGRFPGTELTAEDCWAFRCKSLHQGLSEAHGGRKIDFSPPTSGVTIHQTNYHGIYIISVDIFCEDMCLAVEQWLTDKADDSVVQQRIRELMSFNASYLKPLT